MRVRGIRGATTVEKNEASQIIAATKELLAEMIRLNQVAAEDVASVLITTTEDLNAAFPAQAARSFEGWTYVPLMCAREIPVPGSLPRCIRVMMHVNTERGQREIEHVFLRDAVQLRPDLVNR
ncbi:chorismate mutase [Brevibacillus marinus]|uniref:chorismate mutase n=1 Tax=Brevibacillus marinus TaxID=2496837 RepID=UPI000F824FED|nr:chorismate mutase [Brevibacillus marinus]